jgi:two-component system sensor histidine kinase AgrC
MRLYLGLLGTNYIINISSMLALYYLIRIISSNMTKKKTKEYLVFLFILVGVLTVLTVPEISKDGYYGAGTEILLGIISVLSVMYYTKRRVLNWDYGSILFLLVLHSIISTFFEYFFIFILKHLLEMTFWEDPKFIFILAYIAVFGCVFGIYKWLKESQRIVYIKKVLEYQRFIMIYSVLHLAFDCIYVSVVEIMEIEGNGFVMLLRSLFCLPIIGMIFFVVWETERNRQLECSRNLILQQRSYVKHLEKTQKELRALHHDYKNLLSGMRLQVADGQIEQVEKYLTENLLNIDRNLEVSIKHQNQLTNIDVIEVKSLLLTKLLQAEERGVTINLEVATPIKSINMDIIDFIRVLGILVDNSMEASSHVKPSIVNVLLYEENKYIHLIVKNYFTGEIDRDKIEDAGYSTKGDNRGYGLSNYKEIVGRYTNVLSETKISSNIFTQVLMIGE